MKQLFVCAALFVQVNSYAQNVGIGTTTPTEKLEVNGNIKITGSTPGAGKVLTSDSSGVGTWANVPGTLYNTVFITGFTIVPTTTLAFISTTLFVTITSASQKVILMVSGAFGAGVTAANALNIYAAYRTGAAITPTTFGGGIFGLTCVANQREILSINGMVTGLTPGTYEFGMAGSSTSPNWTNGEFSYVTAMVFN